MFISIKGALYVILNPWKDKGKVLKEHILKDLVALTQELKRFKKSFKKPCEKRAKGPDIAALQRHYGDYLANKNKTNGITIIEKIDEEAEYLYMSISRKHSYIKYKTRVI